MKRFWRGARAVPITGGFGIELDAKPVRLPGGLALLIPCSALADAVAAEWGAAADDFAMDDLPLTRLAGTAQERIAADPAPVATALARYAESDLLCYRAEAPPELVERQYAAWQPWLDWAAARFGARLAVTVGVRHLAQDRAALDTFAGVMSALDIPTLAGLGILVPGLGSLILALAVVDSALSPTAAFELSVLDEMFEVAHWGEDREAAARRAAVAADVAMAARFIQLSHA